MNNDTTHNIDMNNNNNNNSINDDHNNDNNNNDTNIDTNDNNDKYTYKHYYPIIITTIMIIGITISMITTHTCVASPLRLEAIRPVRLLRVWISEGVTQANS